MPARGWVWVIVASCFMVLRNNGSWSSAHFWPSVMEIAQCRLPGEQPDLALWWPSNSVCGA